MSIKLDNDYINRRIDRFLRDKFGILQSKICVLAKQKKIIVNGKNVKYDYRLQKGDNIDILDNMKELVRDNRVIKQARKAEQNAEKHKKDLPIEMVYKLKNAVVFENDDLLVLNKPYGLSVQGGTGVKYCLADFFSILSDKKLRIVHRIDKDTSGILLLAKNVETAVKLTEMFKKREIHKRYLAVLSGIPMRKSGTIKTYIFQSLEDNIGYNARTTEERMNGKQAITKYNVIRTNKEKNLSLVEFFPLTGRKHQIRLHSQHIKCPIVGDEKYGFDKDSKHKKLQLFAIEIDASPIIKISLQEKDFPTMIEV